MSVGTMPVGTLPVALPSRHVARLVSRVEITELLGVSKQRTYALISRPDFPAPVADLGIGKVWDRDEVLDWMRRTGRLPAGEGETSG